MQIERAARPVTSLKEGNKMEIRQHLLRVPPRPIVLLVACLSVLALALAAWYLLSTGTASVASVSSLPVGSCTSYGPDPYSPSDPICAKTTTGGDPYSPGAPPQAAGKESKR